MSTDDFVPTLEFRFVVRRGGIDIRLFGIPANPPHRILQQKWRTVKVPLVEEWRDVPTVEEETLKDHARHGRT